VHQDVSKKLLTAKISILKPLKIQKKKTCSEISATTTDFQNVNTKYTQKSYTKKRPAGKYHNMR